MTILKVENLTQVFEYKKFLGKSTKFRALDNVSFELKQGEILGLLGPNGAGKTTIIQTLLGLLWPTSGSVKYWDKDILKYGSEILQDVTFTSTYLRLPGSLTVRENLYFAAELYGVNPNRISSLIREKLSIFGLYEHRDRLTSSLSAGQLTSLMLSKAFFANPKVVLLDEPSAALDPHISHYMRKFIVSQRDKHNTSILLTSHDMSEVEEICDRVLVLKEGKLVADETPEQLAKTVTQSTLRLRAEPIDKICVLVSEKGYRYHVDGPYIIINLDEQQIPLLLMEVVKNNIQYTEISIDKPTLEDYFMELAK